MIASSHSRSWSIAPLLVLISACGGGGGGEHATEGGATDARPPRDGGVDADADARPVSDAHHERDATGTSDQGAGEAGHAQTFKFHPGFYIGLDSNTSLADQLAMIDTLGDDPHIAGFQHFTKWATLENPNVPGDYSGSWDSSGESGFTRIDALVNKCASHAKQLMLGVTSSAYGGGVNTFPSSLVPAYLSGSAYGPTSGSPSSGMRQGGAWFTSATGLAGDYVATSVWWDPSVMARVLALATAFGARYDANPAFEMFMGLGESAVPAEAGYSDSAALAQLTGPSGYFEKVRAAWPTTLCRWAGNYTGTDTDTEAFIQAAVASHISIGGPDCTNETGTHARGFWVDVAYRGITLSGAPDAGNPDYVGQSDWVSEVQYPDLGPNPPSTNLPAQLGSGVLSDILDHANLQGATHMVWWIENYTGPSTNRYPGSSPNLLDFLHANTLTNSTYPPLFP